MCRQGGNLQGDQKTQSRRFRAFVIFNLRRDGYCRGMIRRLLFGSLSAIALFTALPAAGQAQTFDQFVKATVLPGWKTQSGTQMAGLRLELAEGWKTYWRSPGEAGIPPSFSWEGSDNFGSVKIHWPTPKIYDLNGLETIGYKNSVVIPLEFTPRQPDQPITLDGSVNLGVCEDVCIPVNLKLTGVLSPQVTTPDSGIQAALDHRPTPAAMAGIGTVLCSVMPMQDGLRLTVRIPVAATGGTEKTVVELADPAVWVSEAKTTRAGDAIVAVSDLYPEPPEGYKLDPSLLRFTVFQEDRAIDIRGCQIG